MTPNESYTSARLIKNKKLTLKRTDFVALAREVIGKGVPFRFMAEGYSMFPFIRQNDIVTIYPLESSLAESSIPEIGDIVAFSQPKINRLLVHRIIKKSGDSFIAAGDKNLMNDGIIRIEYIIGHVKKIERGDRLISFGMGPEKRAIAFLSRYKILYPILAILIGFYRSIKKVISLWKT